MKHSPKFDGIYNVCVIDIGSPKNGNLAWCLLDVKNNEERSGTNLDDLFPHIADAARHNGLILGLEAPLSVPIRQDLMLATKGRKGEGSKPWSAGAGAQVLTINLPIMVYLFKGIKSAGADISYCLNEENFAAKPMQAMIFEAFVSGKDKGSSHIDDARIMAQSCAHYAMEGALPPSMLEHEDNTEFFNLAAAALLRSGLEKDVAALSLQTPVYKPTPSKINA